MQGKYLATALVMQYKTLLLECCPALVVCGMHSRTCLGVAHGRLCKSKVRSGLTRDNINVTVS